VEREARCPEPGRQRGPWKRPHARIGGWGEAARFLVGTTCSWLVLATATTTGAQDTDVEAVDSQSIGHTEDGRLAHPFALQSNDRVAAIRPNRFGTRELVGLLHRAASGGGGGGGSRDVRVDFLRLVCRS
jgi:hypothetical protein